MDNIFALLHACLDRKSGLNNNLNFYCTDIQKEVSFILYNSNLWKKINIV